MAKANGDLHAALEARNRADRKDIRFQLLMAVPTALFGLFLANILVLPLIYVLWVFGISLGLWISLGIFNALLGVAIVIDVKRHPEEQWFEPQYTQMDGSVKGHEFHGLLEHYKGSYGGMPLMTNMSDPGNLAQRGAAISSGFANLIL
ncbi:MAG TPA: hypothetical protein VJU16_01295, partial [Planctomycetota bacterium]|nr:hypothetical protein [Planctomycetota bacterium]